MGAAGRAGEVARGVAGALLSFLPFGANLLRSLATAGAERRRVIEALARWDPPPPAPSPPGPPRGGRLLVIAGEPSGDRIAAGAVAALLRRHPGVAVRGYGGARLAAAGARLDHDLAADAVMGVGAVLRSAPRFVGLYARLLRLLDGERPDALLLVDYPGFNLRAAEAARRRGIPVVWFVAPQIWAWAPWRAARIGRAATDLCVILPFERAFYADRGIPGARYVGYPVADAGDREPADGPLLGRLRSGPGPVLALLPGSRRQEVAGNLPAMLRAAALLRSRRPDLRPVLACAGPRLRPLVDAAVARAALPVEVLDGKARTLLEASRAALAVSGTVTMECLQAGVPTVVAYRVSALGRAAMPHLLTVPRFTLANLLAGEPIFPEHADPEGDVEAMAGELHALLDEGPERARVLSSVERIRARLSTTGTYERVAAVIEAHLPAAGGGPLP
ncbi:MAG: lipid-A-disaccharide synthase [Planctomycetes bacterium]|nr:lipid-A-disaccharide synthase [Planctomycetota bacterium]